MRKIKAFTLTELLIAMGVIAILTALLMPFVKTLTPNKKELMGKRAYYAITAVVSEIINNEICYPDTEYAVDKYGDPINILNNGTKYLKCRGWKPTSGSSATTETGDAVEKLKTLISTKLSANGTASTTDFETSDGIYWEWVTPKDYFLGVDAYVLGKEEASVGNKLQIRIKSDGTVDVIPTSKEACVDTGVSSSDRWTCNIADVSKIITK